jgi:signal transduction histidine kinase/ligand-binding sensor domain-containing protein/DNA-binding response OmpR family regulator
MLERFYLYFLGALLMLAVMPSSAVNINQDLFFQHLSVEQGLPHASVLSINQDSIGYIWIGTRNGLSRYDGQEFQNYNLVTIDHEPKSIRYISQIKPVKAGDLWIISSAYGLLYYDAALEIVIEKAYDEQVKRYLRTVSYFADIGDGTMYLGTNDGRLGHFNPQEGTLAFVGRLAGGQQQVTSIEVDRNNVLWIGSSRGLYKWKIQVSSPEPGGIIVPRVDLPAELNVRKVFNYKDEIWVGTVNGVYQFNDSNESGLLYTVHRHEPGNSESIHNDVVRDMAVGPDEELWLATGNGLSVWDRRKFHAIEKNPYNLHGLNDRYFYSLYFDGLGNLWAGSFFGGVNVSFKSIPGLRDFREDINGRKLHGRIVRTFLEVNDEVWIGTEDGGISIWNKRTDSWRHLSSVTGLINNNIHSILHDQKGRMWIGHFRGGITMIDEKGVFRRFNHEPNNPHSLSSDVISLIYEDRDGDIWVGTYNRGLSHYNDQTRNFTRVTHTFDYGISILGMAPFAEGYIVVTGAGEILYLTKNRFEAKNSFEIVELEWSHGGVSAITTVFINGKDIWIGTASEGLIIGSISDNQFVVSDSKFPFEMINKILADKNNDFWVSTSQSLYKLNKAAVVIKSFHQHHGLGGAFNRDAGLVLSDGSVLMGRINGFTLIKPDVISYDYSYDKVILSQLFVNYKRINPHSDPSIIDELPFLASSITLRHDQNNLSIDFLSRNYRLHRTENYYFRLLGIHEEWIPNGKKRSVTFNNLSPGHYVFEVITYEALSAGLDSMKTTLAITVKPPWWRTFYAYAVYTMFLITGLYLFHKYSTILVEKKNLLRMEKFERQKERELYESKLSFFTNISHELRTPLTLIIGPLEEYIAHLKTSDDSLTLKIIRKNAYRLLHLVNQILDFRKHDSNAVLLNRGHINLVELVKGVVEMFSEAARIKSVSVYLHSTEENLFILGDRAKLEEVFFNLLSNALKFTSKGGAISIELSTGIKEHNTMPFKKTGKHYILFVRVKDSGTGIPEAVVEKIFTPFYSHPEGSSGYNTGIGLALVKEIVELHEGEITAASTTGTGTIFTVQFPFDPDLGKSLNVQIVDDPSYKPVQALPDPTLLLEENFVKSIIPVESEEERPLILIAEDNEDMRAFIKRSLSETYDVVEATDGLEALELTKNLAPELIISDVSMPNMDGLEFCKNIRSHYSTSSIPVILLTVHKSVEKQLEGVCKGADLYLTKPFHADLLREWVRSLLAKKHLITEKIKQELLMEPLEPDSLSTNDLFLIEARKILEANISDSSFSVDKFAEDLGMSRTVMYRKFKQVAGISPKDFIRQTRLKRAAQLLKSGVMNVSEITYAVGYNDLRYFRESFLKQFGVNPSDYEKSDQINLSIQDNNPLP